MSISAWNDNVESGDKDRVYQKLFPHKDKSLLRIIQLASISCKAPMAVISFVGADKVILTGEYGFDFPAEQYASFFLDFASRESNYFEVPDFSKVTVPEDVSSFINKNKITYCAGVQLRDVKEQVIGFLMVFDKEFRGITTDQKEILVLLAEEAAEVLKERQTVHDFSSLEMLFNLSNDLICVASTDGYFIKVNPSFSKLLGWKTDKLLSTSFFELVHPEDLEKTAQEIQKLGQGELCINFCHRFQHEDGSYKILEWVATPDEKTGDLYAIARDITEASNRELELEQKERRQRIFFQNSEGFMCTHDLKGNLLSVNRAGAAMLGYTEKEMVGMSLYELVPESRHEAVGVYLKTIESEGRLSSQMVTQHKNGQRFIWMFNNVLEKGIGEEESYVIGNAIDVTNRVKLEEDLRQTKLLLEETGKVSRVGGWNLDLEHKLVTWTPMTRQIHELDADYEPDVETGINFYKEGESREKIIKALDTAIKEGKPWDEELQLVTSKGNEIWVRAIGKTEFKNGVCTRIFGTFQDIDDSKKAQLELVRTKKLAEEASVAKSEFLANMSHEIRTPLNGVIGFTDLVLKTNLNETQHQYLSIVNQSGNALLSIINDILDFSKIEAGKLELDIDKFDLYEMCAQATDIITYQIQSKGLEMLLNICTDLPRFVYADSVRLKQILVNLLGNASKFTENGEIELKIENLSTEDDEHTFRFSVRDTGIGIKPEKQVKIFEAFSQEDSSTTKRYGGTGLGLTISNSLLKLMDSRLELTSVLGEGSTFYFDVKLKAEKGDRIDWFDVDKIKNVLIVDDNVNNRLIVKQMLLLKNIQSVEASNGFEALQTLATGEKFDVILMDYHMPFMDGLETIQKIRDTFSDREEEQPIMLLHSSSDDHKIIESCKRLHVNHRLIKPLKIQDFYQALSRLYTVEAFKEAFPDTVEKKSSNYFTILVAEDNLVNMLLINTIINKISPNAKLVEVKNGLEAFEYCQNQFPDIILMDVQMPKMNGYEATKSIRLLEKDSHVPIIAFTAGNVKGEREKCLAAGMDDFVVKPVVEETVAAILEKWVDAAASSDNSESNDTFDPDPHYDAAKLKNYTDHDPKVLDGILTIVKSELKDSLLSLDEYIQAEKLIELNEAGHKLYGTAVSSGMKILAKLAVEFEHLEVFDAAKINTMYATIAAEINLVLELIEKED